MPTPTVVATGIKSGQGSLNSNAAVSGSFTPASGSLLIAWCCWDTNSSYGTFTATGGGLDWTAITPPGDVEDVYDSGSFGQGLKAFSAPVPSSPGSMTVSIDPSGNTGSLVIGVIEVTGADISSPIGATASSTHLTDTASITLSGTPANESLILAMRSGIDISASYVMRLSTPYTTDGWVELIDEVPAGTSYSMLSCQARDGGTSTAVRWQDSFSGATVATQDGTPALAFEIKAAASGAFTLTQTVRLDNASSLFAGTVAAARDLAQAARVDNAQAFGAHRVDLGLAEGARLDNANGLFAGAVHLTVIEGAPLANATSLFDAVVTAARLVTQDGRLDNGSTLFAGALAHTVVQGARLDDANQLFAHTLALVISQPGRLDDPDSLFAATVSAEGAQELTQDARLDNAQAFGTHRLDFTVLQGARLDDADTLYDAIVTQGLQLTQTARLDDPDSLFGATLHLAAAQPARFDNANALGAHRVDLEVLQAARLDDGDQLFAAVVTSGQQLTQAARLDNANTLFAGAVAAGFALVQTARVDNANVAFAARVDLGLAQDARLENANALFAGSVAAAIVLTQGQRLDNLSTLFAAELSGGFGVGLDVAYETIKAWTVANWSATALRFENETLDPPVDVDGTPLPFVYFEMESAFVATAEFGSGAAAANVWREEGEAVWHVAVASGTGSRAARGLAEDLARALKGRVLANGVRLARLALGAGDDWTGDGGNFWALPVIAEFVRDGWKLGSD